MSDSLMIEEQDCSDSGWRLAPGEACSWQAPRAHLLAVTEGRLWLAHTPRGAAAARDVVLGAGETLRLAPGDHLVMEGWPRARFEFKLVREPQVRGPSPERGENRGTAWTLPGTGRPALLRGC